MAIEGPIRELALADVLQLVHLSRKTGRLGVWREARSRPARLFFDQGAVVGVESAGDASRLGRLLLLSGRATAAQVEGALAAQRAAPGRRLGALLAEEGVPVPEIERQLRFQVEETLFDLLCWTEGHFRFEEAVPPDPGPIRLRVGTDSLLLEGMRRTDEWSELASGRPDTTLVPRLVEQDAAGATLTLAPAEWEALAAIDGARTLREVAHELGRAEFEVARAVFSLASTGLVELGRAAAPVAAPRTDPTAALHAALAEVERELGAGRLEAAERALGEVEARHPARAEPRVARGRLALRRGRWAEAVSALESAVRLDPLAAEAYLWLGRARVRAGDLEGAAEALATGARLSEGGAGERAARAAALLAELRSLLEEGR